ncbi:MAG TPA: YceI family protein [Longimicrobium sp.]|nr:YceI family protein [Longimicrobium sp.]
MNGGALCRRAPPRFFRSRTQACGLDRRCGFVHPFPLTLPSPLDDGKRGHVCSSQHLSSHDPSTEEPDASPQPHPVVPGRRSVAPGRRRSRGARHPSRRCTWRGAGALADRPTHSELTFRIRHLVSRVNGTFNTWSGTIVADPANLGGGSVSVDIQTASIDTNNERRDTHLRSADFFDAENHPAITFRSTRVVARGNELQVHGNLTIRGVTRPVVLEGRMLEVGGAPGRRRIGFEAETRINRMDYGVSWNRAAEGGGAVLGDEVTISIAIAAVEQPAS